MSKLFNRIIGTGLACAVAGTVFATGGSAQTPPSFYSQLYNPNTWLPVGEGGSPDSGGRYLQDFSYAGYAMGDKPIPQSFNNGLAVNAVTDFGAINTYNGSTNPDVGESTFAIQSAINYVCQRGGGTVFLPAGGYKVRPPLNQTSALKLTCSNLILRGELGSAGEHRTFLVNVEPDMLDKRVISVGPTEDGRAWYNVRPNTVAVGLAESIYTPTRFVRVNNVSQFAVNDMIIIRSQVTPAFRSFHGMGPNQNGCGSTGCWSSIDEPGQIYYRRILGIVGNRLELDIPVRYILSIDANNSNAPVVYKTSINTIYNVGIENISIGMFENRREGETDKDLEDPMSAAANTQGSSAVRFADVKDGWIRNVRSFKPNANTRNIHLLSSGIVLQRSSRGISVIDCYMGFSQNRLGNGNGYLYIISGQESLIQNSVGQAGRHNFQFTGMASSGNVIHGGLSLEGSLEDDFHTYLSHANLIDGHTVSGNRWNVFNRKLSSKSAGITGTQNVFWNIVKTGPNTGLGANPFVISAQFGYGYVIGTRGAPATIDTPTTGRGDGTGVRDWVEGVNLGDSLEPQSLYLDQKRLRNASSLY